MTLALVTSAAARQAKHATRMARQKAKRPWGEDGMAPTRDDIKVPRGTARNLRRKHLQAAYAKRSLVPRDVHARRNSQGE